MGRVLVTGGSGFIGGHCVLRLLADGHEVRTTVRDLSRESEVRATLRSAGAEPGDRLTFAAADLMADAGWMAAAADCEYVLHVASPFPANAPQHEDDLIRPAREGTLRVLRAARDAGCGRVVVTSSFAAIGYGHPPRATPFDERDWTDTSQPVSAYVRSKTLAERAAWDFVAKEGGSLELAVVNPVGVLGPVLGADYASSILLVRRMLDGEVPAVPRLMFGVVDVRDVADLHVRAMTSPAAKGERFLAVGGDFLTVAQAARSLKERLGPAGRHVRTRELPNWLVRLAARFSEEARAAVPELGKQKNATNEKARRLLGWAPRSPEDALVATGESLARLGLLKTA
jgi:dihydroflavonol-4-reductase